MKNQPPKWANKLLNWISSNKHLEVLQGDIYELFQVNIKRYGNTRAKLLFIWDVICMVPYAIKRKNSTLKMNHTAMYRNYLKVALRNIRKSKTFSALNILGLAVGMASFMLIMLWVQYEYSYDSFHKNKNDIYRVLQHIKFDDEVTWAINQGPLGQSLKTEVPEIIESTRFSYTRMYIEKGDEAFREIGAFVDPAFLDIFSVNFIHGDPTSALDEPYSIILTRKYAETIFGKSDVVGETFKVWDSFDVKVTGVIDDLPANTMFFFEYLSPMTFGGEVGNSVDAWNNSQFNTYVLLAEHTDPQLVNNKITHFLDDKPTLEEDSKLSLQALSDIHLASGIDYDNEGTGNKQYVIVFTISGVFILLIAIINFMNLSTSRSLKRAKEVGVRKSIGADRSQLIKQFIVESLTTTFIAFLFAILLAELILPLFNSFANKPLNIDYLNLSHLSAFFAIIILTGFIAGFYPAFILSSFSAVRVFRGIGNTGKGNSGLRKGLVTFQFLISIVLIIGAFTIYNQVNFLINRDLGYDKEKLISIRLVDFLSENHRTFMNEVKMLTGVQEVCSSTSFPSYGYSFSNDLWGWQGKDTDAKVLFRCGYIDDNYLNTFGIELIEGRAFSNDFASDSMAIVINEKAAKVMGIKNPIGQYMTYEGDPNRYTIIGVLKDYHFRSLRTEIEPLILQMNDSQSQYIWIRTESNQRKELITQVEGIWSNIFPNKEFLYSYLDQRMERLYDAEKRIGAIMNVFSIQALIVLILGLVGLISYTLTQRIKELSIRKVFGATTSSLLTLISKDYAKLILIASLVALPISYYVINGWLDDFAVRMPIGALNLMLPIVGIMILSLLLVIGQSLKATRTNIVDNLRDE